MAAANPHFLFKAGAPLEDGSDEFIDAGGRGKKVSSLIEQDSKRREWNRVNAARSRARRKYMLSCVAERREGLVRENHMLLALLERSGVEVSASLLTKTLEATGVIASDMGDEEVIVPPVNASQMRVIDGKFVRLIQNPLATGTILGASAPSPHKRVRMGGASSRDSPSDVLTASEPRAHSPLELTLASEDFSLLRTITECKQHFLITDYSQADNPIVFASHGFWALTGYTPQEILGRNCRFLQGKDTDPRAVRLLSESVREGRDVQVILLNYRKDGSRFWNYLFMSALRDEAGKVLYFVGVQTHVQQDYARALLLLQEAAFDASAAASEQPQQQPSPVALPAPAGEAQGAPGTSMSDGGSSEPRTRPRRRSASRILAPFPDLSSEPGPAGRSLPRKGTTGGLLSLINASSSDMHDTPI